MVGKMAFLVTVITGGPAQILIFPTRWLVTAKIILSRGLDCVDSSGRGEALRPGTARAAIATIPITPILLMVPARSFSLGGLGAMRRYSSYLLGAERKRALVLGVILGKF